MTTNIPQRQFYKVIVIGDSGVGKTNLINRFCQETFSFSMTSTIGLDFKYKEINTTQIKAKLQIWDTAGQQRYQNMTKSYFKKVQGVILVFSLQSQKSYKNIEKWVKLLYNEVEDNIPLVLVGTKFDLSQQRTVSAHEGRLLAQKYKMEYVETSSKLNFNVELPFQLLTQKIAEQTLEDDELEAISRNNTKLSSWKHHVNSCQC